MRGPNGLHSVSAGDAIRVSEYQKFYLKGTSEMASASQVSSPVTVVKLVTPPVVCPNCTDVVEVEDLQRHASANASCYAALIEADLIFDPS